jgi:hypothetical protein
VKHGPVDPGALLIAVLAVGIGPLNEDGPWDAINTIVCAIVLVVFYCYLWPESSQRLGRRHLLALSVVLGFIFAIGLAYPIQIAIHIWASSPTATSTTDYVVLMLTALLWLFPYRLNKYRTTSEERETRMQRTYRELGKPATGVLLIVEIDPAPGPIGGRAKPTVRYVPEIHIRGTFLDVPMEDDEYWRDLAGMEQLIQTSIAQASLALGWHDAAISRTLARLDTSRIENQQDPLDPESAVQQREATRLRWEATVAHNLPDEERRRLLRQRRWIEGEEPVGFEHLPAVMHTQLFVFSLVGLSRGLGDLVGLLKDSDKKRDVSLAHKKLREQAGDLTGARDSLAHPEDWLRGKGRQKGKVAPITPEPIDTEGIQAPGGAIVSGTTDGTHYSITAGNGSLADVNISLDTLLVAIESAQSALNAMPRRGLPFIWPE